ncbi:MAG: RNA polymerase sigma factor [Lewinellaceae bacterium]|nr:RNA polymerase sigma factor [Lewinellaceae bacterium]
MDHANTHRDIVEQCQQGNRQAQFELYRLYSKAMYNVCLRMLKDEFDAEDVLQNAFVDVFMKMHTFKFEASVGSWIKRIVINNCINFLKRRRLQFEELNDRHGEVHDDHEAGAGADANGISVELIKKALFELPDGYRVVFTLYLMEGYDHQEIGEILGITEATSKSQYSRAKKKLREIIGGQYSASSF